MTGRTADISNGVNDTGRNGQLLAGLRLIDFSIDLEFHIAIDSHYEFVRVVNKILPALASGIGRQAATKAAL